MRGPLAITRPCTKRLMTLGPSRIGSIQAVMSSASRVPGSLAIMNFLIRSCYARLGISWPLLQTIQKRMKMKWMLSTPHFVTLA